MANYTSRHTGSEIDKVVDEAVLFTEQSLTDEQKVQARTNLNIYSKVEIDGLELITVEDIDTICGMIIQVANDSGVTF